MDGSLSLAADPRYLRENCLQSRRDRMREAMRAAGHEVVIAYGVGSHSFFQGSNPAWWLTGFKQMGPHMAVILPLDGDPVVVMTPRWDANRAGERSTVEEIVAVEPHEFLTTIDDELTKRQLRRKKIAVTAGRQQPRSISQAWPELLDQAPADAEKLFSDLAKIRDEWSMHCTRQAMSIAEQGYSRLLEYVRPGMPEHEVAGTLETYMREMGAEDNFQLMSASQHNPSVHAPTYRILAEGDVLLAEISPAVDGEFLQICRTAVMGKPTQQQLDNFALLDSALRAGMKAALPGTPVREVVEAINAPINAAGYAKYTVPPYMRTRGHSMGLGSMDPEIALNSGDVIEKGMCFVMHPNQYLPETGYFMCGEPVLITDEGAQPVTTKMGKLDSIPV